MNNNANTARCGPLPRTFLYLFCFADTHTHNRFTALWILSGTTRVSRYQKKHSPTHTHRGHQSSLSVFSIYYNPWHPPYSIRALYSLFPQSLSKFSLVYLLAWPPPLHTPYISSPNHYLLFAAHAHTIATSFAVVLRLCHLILVSLSTLYLGLYLVASRHTSILPFSSLPSEVPPHFPSLQARSHFHANTTSYNLPLTSNDISLLFRREQQKTDEDRTLEQARDCADKQGNRR